MAQKFFVLIDYQVSAQTIAAEIFRYSISLSAVAYLSQKGIFSPSQYDMSQRHISSDSGREKHVKTSGLRECSLNQGRISCHDIIMAVSQKIPLLLLSLLACQSLSKI